MKRLWHCSIHGGDIDLGGRCGQQGDGLRSSRNIYMVERVSEYSSCIIRTVKRTEIV